MDTNMTFRIDSEVKAQMNAICNQLGMTASTAFIIVENEQKECPLLSPLRKNPQ